MKNALNNLLGAALIASACSFIAPSAGIAPSVAIPAAASAIKGRIDPADGAVEALAVSATDTARVAITDGMFLLNVGHGTYKLVIVARPPYKNVVKDNVEVADGNTTDVGTVRMQE